MYSSTQMQPEKLLLLMFLSHKVCVFSGKATSFDGGVMMGSRGVISDKWSMRILWGCALGSAIGDDLISTHFRMFLFTPLLANHI